MRYNNAVQEKGLLKGIELNYLSGLYTSKKN